MTEHDPAAADPWMTIAEFAEELRVRPVTVRSWIAKGQLRATRAGQRKWLIRRSELRRMLDGDPLEPAVPPPPPPSAGPRFEDYPPEILREIHEEGEAYEREEREQDYAVASYDWEIALEQSRMAPPDARFAARIRQIGDAAARRAVAIRGCMYDPAFVWKPRQDSAGPLSYELRPGGNRPGPKDAWARFDRVVARLGAAMAGSSASAVASALEDLASAMQDLAGAIEQRPPKASDGDEDGRPDGPPGAE